jgi:hypothetical protein
MTNRKHEPGGGMLAEAEKTRYRVMLESIYKFRFFLVGLIFAILSFAMQFPVKSDHVLIKLVEVSSWVFLVISGYFAIKDCGGFASKIT